MAGSYPGFVAHDVFADEGQELPLLASRAARERRGCRFLGNDGSKLAKRGANSVGGGFNRGLRLNRGFRHNGFVSNDGVQLLGSIIQKRHRLRDGPEEMGALT